MSGDDVRKAHEELTERGLIIDALLRHARGEYPRRRNPLSIFVAPDVSAVRAAVASVSLSHENGCRCTTCRAAAGDAKALAQIMADLARRAVLAEGETT